MAFITELYLFSGVYEALVKGKLKIIRIHSNNKINLKKFFIKIFYPEKEKKSSGIVDFFS